ncbi:urokinase plasminogen activator surface receptor-like [Chelmon rostratus]|uniref:urokinase plasminogen activator surface receptor-like n=1 Tax=Chelmon rostratus TaxID=109905 RepID=UPI001BE5F410|nr:urokinase plasminogen activator surface receptor-like [Chelmon rostratus]
MHLLALVFGIVLLPAAYPLKCYECIPGSLGTCTDTQRECPSSYQCAALKVTSYAGASELLSMDMKSCALPVECVDGSINFGISRTVLTSKCCNSELCNTQPAPAPSKSNPNGKKCYFCNGQECTATLNCLGSEDHCISTTVSSGGAQTVLKGCASKLLCSATQNAQIQALIGQEISCCQGDFCNSASSISAGLLLLVAPLVSLFTLS